MARAPPVDASRSGAGWHPAGYAGRHDALAGAATSGLSPYLHFGCVSALSVVSTPDLPVELIRQMCWRDFFYQVLAGFPRLGQRAYRRGVVQRWRDDPAALAAWQEGRTGVPIVDAGCVS